MKYGASLLLIIILVILSMYIGRSYGYDVYYSKEYNNKWTYVRNKYDESWQLSIENKIRDLLSTERRASSTVIERGEVVHYSCRQLEDKIIRSDIEEYSPWLIIFGTPHVDIDLIKYGCNKTIKSTVSIYWNSPWDKKQSSHNVYYFDHNNVCVWKFMRRGSVKTYGPTWLP